MCVGRRGVEITDGADMISDSEMKAHILDLGYCGTNRSRKNLQFRVILVEMGRAYEGL